MSNIALDEVGMRHITDIAESGPTGELCRRHIDASIRYVLAQSNWFFATKTLKISPEGGYDPLTNIYQFQYAVPANSRIIAVTDTVFDQITEYSLEGGFLYATPKSVSTVPEPVIHLRYLDAVASSFAAPEHFGQVVAYFMASRIVKKADSSQTRGQLYQLYKRELSVAKRVDASQKAPQTYGIDTPYSFLDARI